MEEQTSAQPEVAAPPVAPVYQVMMPNMMNFPGISPPKYAGKKDEDVYAFCVNMQRYIQLFNMDERQAMIVMAMHLSGIAAKWFNETYPHNTTAPSQQVLDKLHDTFIKTVDKTQLRHRFHYLVQKGDVSEYGRQFLYLMGTLKISDSPQIVFQFINGLKRETKSQLATTEFQSVQDAIMAATKYDSTMFGRSGSAPQIRTKPNDDSFMDVDPIETKPGKQVSSIDCKRFGLCFYCKERGHRIDDCPNRKVKKAPQ
ncbi:hypothetical protein GGI05_002267 [Coemansia sp. RSA 2603]|nr:hypothetical protein GGI05_002267 [Coemansia sp. RSA 2603]